MEALRASSFPSLHLGTMITRRISTTTMLNNKPMLLHVPLSHQHHKLPTQCKNSNFKLSTAVSSSVLTESREDSSPEQETQTGEQEEKFDWYAQWYPIMPVCDLDKRRPHGKKVIGVDIVVWWDRNDEEWKVFDDACPHRLAPLSEGRIDQWGRLQCVYHGWCFNGSGDCKFIPQAPRDGPPIHTSKRACVAAYPSCVQNGILWFWPNADPQYKDIFLKKKPPYVPEIDDPSFTKSMICRDIPYGYEVLIENLMDPAHVPYAHYGIMRVPKPPKSVKADREGGRPLEISIVNQDINGFTGKQMLGSTGFFPPCLYYGSYSPGGNPGSQSASSAGSTQESSPVVAQKRFCLAFFCIPVSPGHSRLIFTSPRNVGVWVDRVIPRWIFHIGQNLILDSDLYLLHVEERKLTDIGPFNWHKSCFVPTKADALVVAFRRWLNKYGGGRVDWGTKYSGALPPTPPREQLFDRYWSHTVNCRSCNFAYKSLNALEVALQVISIVSIGIVAAAKQSVMTAIARNILVSMAVVCFVTSKWLSHFIYKNFHYHDYDHAFR